MASRWTLFLEWGSILSLIVCAYWIFMLTPIETSQGFSQKIMYLHVPTVIVTYLAFFIVSESLNVLLKHPFFAFD